METGSGILDTTSDGTREMYSAYCSSVVVVMSINIPSKPHEKKLVLRVNVLTFRQMSFYILVTTKTFTNKK
jgi:hypothetical protein